MTRKRHHLFHRELSDAPGRNEQWDNYLRYLGNNRWELITETTGFYGSQQMESETERMSTKRIIQWAFEMDEQWKDEEDLEGKDESSPCLGPYTELLHTIAIEEKADYCVACLDGWLAEKWPPEPIVRILGVTGVTRRAIWFHIHHPVFAVETNRGPAYLYPPDANRWARLVFASEGNAAKGRNLRVPRALMLKIDPLRPELEGLRQKV